MLSVLSNYTYSDFSDISACLKWKSVVTYVHLSSKLQWSWLTRTWSGYISITERTYRQARWSGVCSSSSVHPVEHPCTSMRYFAICSFPLLHVHVYSYLHSQWIGRYTEPLEIGQTEQDSSMATQTAHIQYCANTGCMLSKIYIVITVL